MANIGFVQADNSPIFSTKKKLTKIARDDYAKLTNGHFIRDGLIALKTAFQSYTAFVTYKSMATGQKCNGTRFFVTKLAFSLTRQSDWRSIKKKKTFLLEPGNKGIAYSL